MPWIQTIDPEDAPGELADACAWQAQRVGRPDRVHAAWFLAPALVRALLTLYRTSERLESRLTAFRKFVVAYLTSVLNETPHCPSQVRLKLHESGADAAFVVALDAGRYDELPAAEAALAAFAAIPA